MKKDLIKSILVEETDSIIIQFFRYFFVGGVAFIADFSLLWIFTEKVKINYLISASLSFTVGLIVNYLLSVKWVFINKGLKNKKIEFGIFALIGIFGLLFNELFIWFFTEVIGFYYLFSKIFSTFFVYLWNFFARKFVLYNK